MDRLLGLLANLEAAIRYLLTGVVVGAVWLAAQTDPGPSVAWALMNKSAALGAVLASGFLSFVLYRLIFWAVGDYVAWWSGASAPVVLKRKGGHYPEALARFLVWRYSENVKDSLSGYLTYRWAISHFAVVSAVALVVGLYYRKDGSFLGAHCTAIGWVAGICFVFGLFQCWLLFCVERELFRADAKPA